MSHCIEIEISPDGRVTTLTKGVDGPSCVALTEWIAALGRVEAAEKTADYRKPGKHLLVKKVQK